MQGWVTSTVGRSTCTGNHPLKFRKNLNSHNEALEVRKS